MFEIQVMTQRIRISDPGQCLALLSSLFFDWLPPRQGSQSLAGHWAMSLGAGRETLESCSSPDGRRLGR